MDHRGIAAVASAVSLVLERSWTPGLVQGVAPEFSVYRSRDFEDPMPAGLSVFVHRVSAVSEPDRRPVAIAGRRGGVSVQVSLLVSAWAQTPDVELALLGWAACTLAEHPVLGADLLDDAVPGGCGADEMVQLMADAADASVVDLWQVLPGSMQPSLAFVTSALHLSSG